MGGGDEEHCATFGRQVLVSLCRHESLQSRTDILPGLLRLARHTAVLPDFEIVSEPARIGVGPRVAHQLHSRSDQVRTMHVPGDMGTEVLGQAPWPSVT